MKKNLQLREKIAIYSLLTILSLVVIFHLLVMAGFISYEIVWGGRINSREEMLTFEAVSITINLIMIFVVMARAGFMGEGINPKIIRIALWLMFFLFLLNTVGNIFSENELEKIIFTPLTLIAAGLSFILALRKSNNYAVT